MSQTELVILDSSSPPLPLSEPSVTPKRYQRVIPSSSTPDDLLSPPDLLKFHACTDKRLKSGSRAVKPPEGTDLGFKSVSGLLKQGQLCSEDDSGRTRKEPKENTTLVGGPKLVSKESKAKETARRNGDGKLKKPSNPVEIKTAEKVHTRKIERDPAQITLKPGQNFNDDFQHYDYRANLSPPKSKPSPVGQNGIKASTNPAGSGRSKTHSTNRQKRSSDESRPKERSNNMKTTKSKKSTGKVSKHFAQANISVQDFESVQLAQFKQPHTEATPHKESDSILVQGTVGRMPAAKHPLDQTPPKDTVQDIRSHETAVIDLKRVSLSPLSASLDFRGLMQNFGHVDVDQETKLAPNSVATRQTTKRKRIEFAELTTQCAAVEETYPATESENHVSKRRTRPKTVTGYAIERFRADDEQSVPADDRGPSVFGTRGKVSRNRSTLSTEAAQHNPKTRPPSKRVKITGASKATKSRKAPSKATFVHPPLLNPEMAAQCIARQEEQQKFLFGTSSQLAGEKSPTTLCAIQQSLKEMEGDTSGFVDTDTVTPKQNDAGIKRHLWAVGSKIEDTSLLDELDKENITLPQGGSFDWDDLDGCHFAMVGTSHC
jgi:hypothetical protein